jgi:hypothetical protein
MELASISLRLVGLLVPFDVALQSVRYPTPLGRNFSGCGCASRGGAGPCMYSEVRVCYLKRHGIQDFLMKMPVFQFGGSKGVPEW